MFTKKSESHHSLYCLLVVRATLNVLNNDNPPENSVDANSPSSLLKPMAALMAKDQKSPGQPAAPQPSSNTPPTSSPSTPNTEPTHDSPSASPQPLPPGMLLIRVVEARNLTLPNGSPLQIGSGDKTKVESGGVGGAVLQTGLPYVVIDFDKNEVLVAAKEGHPATRSVTWQHRAHL